MTTARAQVSPLGRRGFLGLTLGSRPEAGAGTGLEVRRVAAGSSGQRAGIVSGDRLTHIAGQAVSDLAAVRLRMRGLRADEPLELGWLRDGREQRVLTTVAPFPLERYVGARCLLDQVDVEGHRLRALCVVPEGPGPFPVLYYLPGAHWASEEYPLAPQHPLPALIAELAAAGVATLRVERSGLGDSEGPSCTRVDYEGEVAGYRAGLSLLSRVAWADAQRLFLFGHSLGAMHAPRLAEQVPTRGVIAFGAGAIPISQALVDAIVRHADLQLGVSAQVSQRSALIAELIRLVVCGQQTPAQVFAQRPDLAAVAPSHFQGDQAYHRVVTFYHQLEACDVAGSWRRYRGPVLALHGSRDYVTAPEDAARIAACVRDSSEHRELPGVDHHMSDVAGGAASRLAPALRDAVLGFVQACR